MKHKGEIIEKEVRESGISITQLAKRMKKSRRHIYNIFASPEIHWETIMQIGKIIHHDFRKDLPDISQFTKNFPEIPIVSESKQAYKDMEYWREKYFELLEKYNKLLEEKIKVK